MVHVSRMHSAADDDVDVDDDVTGPLFRTAQQIETYILRDVN